YNYVKIRFDLNGLVPAAYDLLSDCLTLFRRFITMELHNIKMNRLQDILNLISYMIHKQSNHLHIRCNGLNQLSSLSGCNSSGTRWIKYESYRICTCVHHSMNIFDSGDSTNFGTGSHIILALDLPMS